MKRRVKKKNPNLKYATLLVIGIVMVSIWGSVSYVNSNRSSQRIAGNSLQIDFFIPILKKAIPIRKPTPTPTSGPAIPTPTPNPNPPTPTPTPTRAIGTPTPTPTPRPTSTPTPTIPLTL